MIDPPAAQAPRPTGRLDVLLSVLREPHFGQLYLTRLSSQTADGVFNVALAGFALFSPERQTSPGEVAAAFATLLLPYSLVGPFAGVLIDRWSRQRILVVANLVRAALVLGVIGIVMSDLPTPVFYVGTLLVLSVNRFLLSALSAALPHVVQRPNLVLANSLSTTSGTLVAILGGAAGVLVRRQAGADDAGIATIMATAAVGYVVAAAVASRMDRDLLGPDDPDVAGQRVVDAMRHVLRGVGEGARHVWHRRRAGRALAAIAAHRFFYGLSFIATLLLYNEDFGLFHSGIRGLSQVFGSSALGYLVAAAVTPEATRRLGVERWVALLFAGSAVAELAFALPYTHRMLLAAAFSVGIAAQGSKICVDTIVQESIDDAYRGRVFSFYDIVFNVSFVAAAGVAAVAVPRDGKSYPVVALVAAGYAVTALGYALAARRTRGDTGRTGPEQVSPAGP